ncbi:MAG: hypothetical protein V4615_00755 [Bacteroidota bacterium]
MDQSETSRISIDSSSKKILSGEVEKSGTIKIDSFGDGLVFINSKEANEPGSIEKRGRKRGS